MTQSNKFKVAKGFVPKGTPNLSDRFFFPVLKTYNEDLSKRWRVEYYEPLHNGHSAKRITLYGNINKGRTIEERTRIANELIKTLKFDIKYARYIPKSIFQKAIEVGQLQWRVKTISAYTTIADKFEESIKPLTPDRATEQTINEFLLQLQKDGASVGTLHKYRNILFRLYSLAISHELTDFNPVKKVAQVKKYPVSLSYFSNAQIQAIKNVCEGSQLWLAIRLLFYCFIRPGEQRFLKIGDINFEMGYIEIRGEISKNKKTQKVVIPAHFLDELNYLKEYPNNYYVLGKNGVPGLRYISVNQLNAEHKDILHTLQIRGRYAFYSWKHTGVVKCVQAGLNIRDIQNQLRHHSLEMVQIYLRNLGVLQSEDLKNKFPVL